MGMCAQVLAEVGAIKRTLLREGSAKLSASRQDSAALG